MTKFYCLIAKQGYVV